MIKLVIKFVFIVIIDDNDDIDDNLNYNRSITYFENNIFKNSINNTYS